MPTIAAPDRLPVALTDGGTKTAAFTASAGTAYVVTLGASLGAVAITLPTTPPQGTEVLFTRNDTNTTTSTATVTGGGTDTVDNGVLTTWILPGATVARLIYQGTNWSLTVGQQWVDRGDNEVPSYAIPTSNRALLNRYDPSRGIYNYKSSNTRVLDQGISDVMAGGISHHLVIGDSVTAGATSGVGVTTYDRLHAWPLMMRDQFALTGVPANGTGLIRMNDNSTLDARIVVGSGWTFTNLYGLFASVAASNFTVTFDRGGTVLDFVYYNNGSSTVTVSIDGAASGSNFGTFTTGALTTPAKFRMSGVTIKKGSTAKVTLTVAGTGCVIYGLSCWTPNSGLVVHNAAQSGSTATSIGNAAWSDLANGPLFAYKDLLAGRKRTITDAATTAGSNVLTSATAAFTTLDQGDPIYQFPDTTGALFPPNTYMVTRTSATTMVMNNNALVTASAKTIQISADPDCIHICLGGNDIMQFHPGTMSGITTAITTIRNVFPNSDCILHLENEPSPTLASAADELSFQKAMYQLADTLDLPLYDWRDRAGNYATAFANGVMQDYQAHMTPGMYADLGASLAWIIGGGSGHPQSFTDPVGEGDLVPKYWFDGLSRFKAPLVASGTATSGTTEQIVYQFYLPPNILKAGTSFRINLTGTITGTSPTLLSRLRFGTAGTTSDAAITATTASAAMATGTGWSLDIETTIRTVGATGTIVAQARVLGDAILPKLSAPASVTINTTVASFFTVTLTPGGTSPVATVFQGFIETDNN